MEWFSLPDRFDAALRSIGRGWPGPGPLARGMPPCASARHSFAEWHYGRLVGALAAAWAGLKETRPFLMERARTDEQPVVRSAALEAITRHYRSHPDTKPLVLDLARNDSDGNVRSGALWPLAHYFRNDPETKTLLLDLARTDHDEGVRRSALLRWAGAYRGRSDVVLLSRDLDGFDPGVIWMRRSTWTSLRKPRPSLGGGERTAPGVRGTRRGGALAPCVEGKV